MRIILAILAAILFVAPSAAYAQKVSVDYDKSANFSSYKTFAWAEGQGARNPIVNQMIITAVERELTARGLSKTAENPDVRIAFLAAVGMDLEVTKPGWANPINYGGVVAAGPRWNVTTGTLLIDLLDAKLNRSVWRGTIKEVLSQAPSADAAADARRVEKTVTKGIAKMFKKYPVSAKKSS